MSLNVSVDVSGNSLGKTIAQFIMSFMFLNVLLSIGIFSISIFYNFTLWAAAIPAIAFFIILVLVKLGIKIYGDMARERREETEIEKNIQISGQIEA